MKGNIEKFDEVLQTILKFVDSKLPEERSSWTGDGQKPLDWLHEKGCGNQNIMHLCAANLTPERQNGTFCIISVTDREEIDLGQ